MRNNSYKTYSKLDPDNTFQNAEHKFQPMIENPWILKDNSPEFFLLTRNKASILIHLILALLLGWWLFFIPNLLYHYFMIENIKIYKKHRW